MFVQTVKIPLTNELDKITWKLIPGDTDEYKYGIYKCEALTNIKSKKPLIISCDEIEHPEYSIISHAFLDPKTGTLYLYRFADISTTTGILPLTIIELP